MKNRVYIRADGVPAPDAGMRKLIRDCCAATLRNMGRGSAEISVLLTDDDGIRAINLERRALDKPTDVLSFPVDDDEPMPDGLLLLGDIVVSLQRVTAQAAEYGHTERRELAFLIVHGMLHLCGLDHEIGDAARMDMEARQEHILLGMGITKGNNAVE